MACSRSKTMLVYNLQINDTLRIQFPSDIEAVIEC